MSKKMLTSMLFMSGLFSGFASAQQGELIVNQSYIKPGCSGWNLNESGATGAPSGGPHTYQVYTVSCNGGYVVRKTQLFYSNGSLYSCRIDLVNSTSYTLNSNACTSFEVRAAVVPAAPAYAYIGRVGSCGPVGNGYCPEYWVSWASVAGAANYQYSLNGTLLFSGSTTGTSVTVPYGYNPASGQVRACNASNQCSAWTAVTAPPQ
ncbi:hypothetical protein [Cellvibrio mixtus]|uniref:hypothetical protein n=1 Tax=Cellvibrio mixtus TaxID=39650 RepID=UPI000587819F|nr:hypothetical protein [Cellvibrio mixtus]